MNEEIMVSIDKKREGQARMWANLSLVATIIAGFLIGVSYLFFFPFTYIVQSTIGCVDSVLIIWNFLPTIPLAFAIISLNKKWTKLGATMLRVSAVFAGLCLLILAILFL